MPRGRGGKRDGVVGKNYANRTDLQGQNVVSAQPQNQPGVKLANQTATGQPYGAATAQKNAMDAVPIQNTGVPTPSATGGSATPAPQNTPLTPLTAPGDPNTSLFHGMDAVPGGAGSEAMIKPLQNTDQIRALALLDQLPAEYLSPQINMIKNYLRAQGDNGLMQ